MNAALKASVYEPRFNLQFDLQAARYLYGDYGVRGDCTRHFGEYAIGVYGMYTDGEINGGFHFAIPLPGKKWSRNRGVRVRQADYFAMEYSMESWGRYADEKWGKLIAPDLMRTGVTGFPTGIYTLFPDKGSK